MMQDTSPCLMAGRCQGTLDPMFIRTEDSHPLRDCIIYVICKWEVKKGDVEVANIKICMWIVNKYLNYI